MRPILAICVVALAACHPPTTGDPPHATPIVGARVIDRGALAYVPADTPYVFVSLEPIPETIRRRMVGIDNAELLGALAKLDAPTPFGRAMHALAGELRDGDRVRDLTELGFPTSPRFAFYGLSIWPVLRMEVADTTHLREVATRVLAAAGSAVQTASFQGHPYWAINNGKVQLIAIVRDREVVVALVPTATVTETLPLLFATTRPAKSLADTDRLGDTARRYHVATWLGYLDLRILAGIFTGHATGLSATLTQDLRAGIPGLAACDADLERLAAWVPRVVLGYQRLDERGFAGALYVETPGAITRALAQLQTRIPGVGSVVAGDPLVAVGVAAKLDDLIALGREVIATLRAHPFTCPALAAMPLDDLDHTLATPLPLMLQGARGAALVVDDLSVEQHTGTGHALVVGAHAPELVRAMLASLFPGTPMPALGVPVALPLDPLRQAGFALSSAHLMLAGDDAAIAVGPDSERRALRVPTLPGPTRSPFFTFAYDIARFRRLFPDNVALQNPRFAEWKRLSFAFDVGAFGLVLTFDGAWN
ncbi:MAG: hypothetical protein NT062_04010 [Proteobacteria bacterium]|nr:hypothetical protein [Pseudomonadota bacterium]